MSASPKTLERRLRIPDEVIARDVGDGTVMLDLAKGAYYGLDGVGSFIWGQIAAGRPLAEVVEAVVGEFEVERGVAERDLLALVEDLVAQGLVVDD